MFHAQLRQFPHNVDRFNLGERELLAILVPWVQGRTVELGEHKWSAENARVTVLEGPHLELGELSMGRGWGTAERRGVDVTERALAWAGEVAQAMEAGAAAPAAAETAPAAAAETAPAAGAPAQLQGAPAAGGTPPAASAEGAAPRAADLQALLGARSPELLAAWQDVAGRAPGLAPSESLALAERNIGVAGPGAPGATGGR